MKLQVLKKPSFGSFNEIDYLVERGVLGFNVPSFTAFAYASPKRLRFFAFNAETCSMRFDDIVYLLVEINF